MKKNKAVIFLLGALAGMAVMYLSIPEGRRNAKKKAQKKDFSLEDLEDDFFDEEIAKDFDREDKEEDYPHVTMGEVLYDFLEK